MTKQSDRVCRCNSAAIVSQVFRAFFTLILRFPKDIKRITFHLENCHQTQMLLNTQAAALGDLANRYRTPSLVWRKFPSLQERRHVPSCVERAPIFTDTTSAALESFSWAFPKLHCGWQPQAAPSCWPRGCPAWPLAAACPWPLCSCRSTWTRVREQH